MHGASVLRLLDIELIHVQLYMYSTQKKYRLILCQLHQFIPFKTYATFNIERFVAAVMYILQFLLKNKLQWYKSSDCSLGYELGWSHDQSNYIDAQRI